MALSVRSGVEEGRALADETGARLAEDRQPAAAPERRSPRQRHAAP